MKQLFFATSLLFISFFSFATSVENGHDLTIAIPNVKSNDGKIQIGLFNKAENFPKNNKQFKTVILKAKKGTQYTFKNLPDGDYAIAVMHDENNNGKCDFNFLGIPSEGYGFSNNVKPKLSAPSFKSTKINLNSNKTISINLIY